MLPALAGFTVAVPISAFLIMEVITARIAIIKGFIMLIIREIMPQCLVLIL